MKFCAFSAVVFQKAFSQSGNSNRFAEVRSAKSRRYLSQRGSQVHARSVVVAQWQLGGNSSRGNCNSEEGRDWFGNDINQTPFNFTTPQACCNACKENSECVGWLFRRMYNHCYLKKSLQNAQPCGDCVRGRTNDDVTEPPSTIERQCNSKTGTDWFGGDLYNTPFDISDPGVCCEYCRNDNACKGWIWRGAFNHCWLKNVINSPSDCEDCTGGILDEPVTQTIGPPLNFRTRCANDGERVAVRVAAGACAVLENRCPPAATLVDLAPADNIEAPPSESDTIRANEAILKDAFDQALRESCITIFEETCKRTAIDKAAIHFQECASILEKGPEFSTRKCSDVNDALRIFSDAVEPLCDFDSSIDKI